MIIRFFIALGLLLLVTACTTQPVVKRSWPEGIPTREYFESVYYGDEENRAIQTVDEYLLWVIRYYQGWELYRRGWVDVTGDLVEQIDEPDIAKTVEDKMNKIGQSVAGEWAKKSKNRKIYTRHVAIWGNALVESLNRGEELKLIEIVADDVSGLLANKVSVDAITADRYYAQDENDAFW